MTQIAVLAALTGDGLLPEAGDADTDPAWFRSVYEANIDTVYRYATLLAANGSSRGSCV